MKKDISNNDDVIDSREVIERIEELQDERENLEFMDDEEKTLEERQAEWDESEEGEELKHLKALQDELEDYCPDWRFGVTLIRESYFTEYCKDLVKEIDALPSLPQYIESNINWDGVAEYLQADYTSGEFDDVTYWAR